MLSCRNSVSASTMPIISKYVRIYAFSVCRLAIWIHRPHMRNAFSPCRARGRAGRPYFKTYHLTRASRTTIAACVAAGKCVSSFHMHDGPLKYFTRDPESVLARVIQIDSKSNGEFTVARNYFYTSSHPRLEYLKLSSRIIWTFRRHEDSFRNRNLMSDSSAIIEMVKLLIINDIYLITIINTLKYLPEKIIRFHYCYVII